MDSWIPFQKAWRFVEMYTNDSIEEEDKEKAAHYQDDFDHNSHLFWVALTQNKDLRCLDWFLAVILASKGAIFPYHMFSLLIGHSTYILILQSP